MTTMPKNKRSSFQFLHGSIFDFIEKKELHEEAMKAHRMVIAILGLILFFAGSVSADEMPSNTVDAGDRSHDVENDGAKLPMGPIFITTYGLVTVCLGAGFGLQAYQENKDFNKKEDGRYPLASKSLADDIKAHSIVANVLMFGGAAAVIGGVLWWLLDDNYKRGNARKRASAFNWSPVIGPNHASVVAEF